jgi:hypothetical protein
MRGLGWVVRVKWGEEEDMWGRDGLGNQTDQGSHDEAWDRSGQGEAQDQARALVEYAVDLH